jgi:ribose-phosphate pyrophosphokinase
LAIARVAERKNYCIVAPDAGASKHAIQLALELGVEAVIINKYRPEHQAAEAYNLIGDPAGKECVIVDDMIDTGGTISMAAGELKRRGGKSVSILVTHGLFSRNAAERIEASEIDEVFVSDSLPLKLTGKKIKVVSIARLLAQAIHHTHHNESVHQLFE